MIELRRLSVALDMPAVQVARGYLRGYTAFAFLRR